MVQEIKEKTKQKARGIYPRGGWLAKPFHERKVHVWGTVKAKHFDEAMEAIKELLKQYR